MATCEAAGGCVTPEDERPTGWVLICGDRVYGSTLYGSMSAAEDGRLRALNVGVKVTPTPLWSRDAWSAEMARLALARGE